MRILIVGISALLSRIGEIHITHRPFVQGMARIPSIAEPRRITSGKRLGGASVRFSGGRPPIWVGVVSVIEARWGRLGISRGTRVSSASVLRGRSTSRMRRRGFIASHGYIGDRLPDVPGDGGVRKERGNVSHDSRVLKRLTNDIYIPDPVERDGRVRFVVAMVS